MLNRSQIDALTIIRNRAKDPNDPNYSQLSKLPNDLIREIGLFGRDDTAFNKALRHAALGTDEDLAIVVEMVKANPSLLLLTGHVVTRGGVDVRCTTLYEFFLGEGDPDAAKQIEPYFAEMPNGEQERIRQYERYRPYIEALSKQLKANQSAYDLKPLIDIIKESSPEDIQAALNKDMKQESKLSKALTEFRTAVNPKRKTVGMHYEHYTTLLQALNLLYDEWEKLSSNYTNYDKCYLVWRQIIGYLQRSLPAVDRFAFARAFDDKERTPNFKYGQGSFPDSPRGSDELSGVGFDNAIYVQWPPRGRRAGSCAGVVAGKYMSSKSIRLGKLMQPHQQSTVQTCVIL